jgi:predicted PurR-regulated permease PerM
MTENARISGTVRETHGSLKGAVKGWFLPFLVIFILLAYLSFEVSFSLIRPMAWAALVSFTAYPLFRRMRERFFPSRSASMPALLATGIIVFAVLIPCLLGVFFAVREGVRLHGSVVEVMAAMESSGEGALATLLPEHIVAKIRPLMERYPALRAHIRQTAERGAAEAVEFFGSAVLFLYYFSIITVANFFFLRDGHRIVAFIREIIPLPAEEGSAFFERTKQVLRAVVYGVLVTALAQGAAGGVGWWISGLPAPVFFGALMVFFALIPFLGTAFVWIPGALYLLLAAETTQALVLLAWGVLVVGTVGRVLKPIFISGGGKIHFFIVFIGVIGGLASWGILGLFIGPLVLTLFAFLLENYRLMWRAWIGGAHEVRAALAEE